MVSSTAFSSALVQGPPREFKERIAAPVRQCVRKIRSQNDSECFFCWLGRVFVVFEPLFRGIIPVSLSYLTFTALAARSEPR